MWHVSLLALKQGQKTLLLPINGFSFLFEATPTSFPPVTHIHTYKNAHAMSSASITGNNWPPSFIVGWRWFPQGATGSLRCQPDRRPQQCCGEPCARVRLLVSLSSSEEGLTHGLPAVRPRLRPIEWVPLSHVKSSQTAANWQGLHYWNNSFEEMYFTALLQSRVLSEAWLEIK